MNDLEQQIGDFLEKRRKNGLFREASPLQQSIDFTSNDYLGLSKSAWIKQETKRLLDFYKFNNHGATGSRLLSGTNVLVENLEKSIARFHNAPSALLFNSGYTANIGVISTLARENHYIFYDELIHASIVEGIKLSKATPTPFEHNNLDQLEGFLNGCTSKTIFIIVESLYSMEGDKAPIDELQALATKFKAYLIVDEAHAVGVYGKKGEGLCQNQDIFCRIVTYGKAFGIHGAAVLCSENVRSYLINYCKSFIYTTASSLSDLCVLYATYEYLYLFNNQRNKLNYLINYFKIKTKGIRFKIIGDGPIFSLLIRDAFYTKKMADYLQINGFYIKAILSPTVPKGSERLRINLHSYNTTMEIDLLIQKIQDWEMDIL